MLTSKVLELCARQQRVQGMAKLVEERFGLVGAHQATTREPKAAHQSYNRFLVASIPQAPSALQCEVRCPSHLTRPAHCQQEAWSGLQGGQMSRALQLQGGKGSMEDISLAVCSGQPSRLLQE